jgi:hypothetical protein
MPVKPNAGLSSAVQQALQRRQAGGATPQLSQVSPQAPVDNPVQPMNPSQMGQPSIPKAGSQATSDPESEMIIKALIDTLKTNNKLKTQAATPAEPTPQLPMGGGYYKDMGGGGNQKFIQNKIPILRNEGYPQDQAVAIAHSMANRRS